MYVLKNQQTFGDQDLKFTIIYKNHIITVGRSPNIYIYNPETKETITINTNFSSISSAILFSDSLILGTQIGTILIYNNILENTIPMYLAGHTQSVCSLDAYEHFLLSSSWDGSIRLWDLLNYRELSTFSVDCCVWQARFFKSKINGYNAIDFYCACANKSILLYKNKEMYKSFVFHLTAVRGVLFYNDSVYSIGNDGKIMKSNIDGKLLRVTDIKEFLYCLTIDNDKVYVCGENGIVVVCDLDLNIIWKTKTEIQSCWNVNVQNNNIYISGSCGNSLVFEEGDEPELVEDNSSHKLKDKNYKVMNGKVYYLVNDKWTLVGDVVEQNYDHTFSVEVDGKFLKICFNENDDVYNVADKFLLENNLNKDYRDDIVEFIRKNYTPKQALFMYKDINLEGVKKYLKDEVIIENLENPDNKNSKEVEERLKKLLDEENNFYVLDCYRFLHVHDYEFDFTFLQDYKVNDKKSGTVFLRLVCNMYKNLPYNMSILKSKIDKIIDMKFADDRTIANYMKNKDISDK